MKFTALLLAVLLIGGCSRNASESSTGTSVVLQPGTGALLIIFPEDQTINRGDWLTQVTMKGPSETRALPRVPLSDLQSVLVLHIQPGSYSVTASAWGRKQPLSAGGSRPEIEIRAGQMTVLRAKPLKGDTYPHANTMLEFVRIRPWLLDRADRFQGYIADVVKETSRG